MTNAIIKIYNLKYLASFIFSLCFIAIFQFSYFDNFVPIQDAWFVLYAKHMNDGQQIYKDFYSFVQPVYPYIFQIVSHFFGYDLINFRYYGLLERVLLISSLYLLFYGYVSPIRMLYCTLLSVTIFITCTADVIYSYYQLVVALVILSAYFVNKYLKNENLLYLLIGGFVAGVPFMTKQSTGLIAPFFLCLGLACSLFFRFGKISKAFIPVAAFGLGFVLPAAIYFLYAYKMHFLWEYIGSVFLGASSKGSMLTILTRFLDNAWPLPYAILFCVSATLLMYFSGPIPLTKDRFVGVSGNSNQLRNNMILVVILLISLICAISFPSLYIPIFSTVNYISVLSNYAYLMLYFNISLIAYLLIVMHQDYLVDREYFLLLSFVSFGVIYSHGLSGFIEQHSTILITFLFCLTLLELVIRNSALLAGIVYVCIAMFIQLNINMKTTWMYSWWGWDETNSYTATIEPKVPLLGGFRLNIDKSNILISVYNDIIDNSIESDSIFIFPHMPMFYLISGRRGVTFSDVHYFDVCPDDLARSDSNKVRSILPKVIVYMDMPKDVWDLNEKVYRGSKPSGQREFQKLIAHFVDSEMYYQYSKYIPPGYNYPVYVYVRK